MNNTFINATSIYRVGGNNYQGGYIGTKSNVLSNFSVNMTRPNYSIWGRLLDSDTGEFIASHKTKCDELIIPQTGQTLKTTAVYHDGKHGYQVNYQGTYLEIMEDFKKDMISRQAVWGRLFYERSGEYLGKFDKENSELNDESSPSKDTVVFSSKLEYSRKELIEIIMDVCGEAYAQAVVLPTALEKAAVLMWMDGESLTDRACMVRSALTDLTTGDGALKFK